MKYKIRMTDREWSANLWSRIRNLITGLNDRLEGQEQAGYITQETDPTVPAWAKEPTKPTYTAGEVGAIPTTQKGAASGVAELDSGGKVPSSQLPSYVDDVLEYSSRSAFPSTGEAGIIYVATDTNITYRWSGSGYVEISPSLALGETSSTAYRGDRGKAAYDHAQAHGSAFNSGLYKITTNSEGHVTGATAVQKSDITELGIPGADTTYTLTQDSTDGHKLTFTGSDGSSIIITIPDNDTTYTFSDNDPTLAWGTRSKIGTTGGVELHVTMPAKPTYNTSDLTNDGDGQSPFATQDYVGTNGGKIDVIKVNGTTQTITNKAVDLDIPVVMTNAEIDAIMDAEEEGALTLTRYATHADTHSVPNGTVMSSYTSGASYEASACGLEE